jgi:hypothetical protein
MAGKIIYDHIEFFFSKETLHSIVGIDNLSYDDWARSVMLLKTDEETESYQKLNENDKQFVYNIQLNENFLKIKKIVEEIEKQIEAEPDITKINIDSKVIEMKKLTEELEFYDEIYLSANRVFNKIRQHIHDSYPSYVGGGLSLEDFKEMIRQKVKLIKDQ